MAGVMRDAQQFQTQQPGMVSGPQDNTNFVRPDYQKYSGTLGRVASTEKIGTDPALTTLAALGAKLTDYAQTTVQRKQQEAYIAGQADAASGQAQASVDNNPFTKDFTTTGFADTKARLGVADAVAQTAVDIKNKYKEVSPEEFKTYLAERREKVMALQQGMSQDARKSMMVQLIAADQTAIAQHAEAYRKFVVDQQIQSVNTSMSVANDALNSSKGDPTAYENASRQAVATLWGSVLNNPNLDNATRQKMVGDAAGLMLAHNNERAYEIMRDEKDPNTGHTMLDLLPFDTQTSLAKAYASSRKDSADMRTSAYMQQVGLLQSKLDDPMAEPVSYESMRAFIDQGIQMGVMPGEKQASLMKQWADSQVKKQKVSNTAGAWAAGDINTMFRNGADDDQGADAWVTMNQRRGMSAADAITGLAQIGLSTGSPAAFKTIGKLMKGSISQIGMTADIDPSQLSGLNAVLNTIGQAEQKGDFGARTAFLGSFDEATRSRLVDYTDALKKTGSTTAAAQDAATRAQQDAALSPAAKAALAAGHANENQELVNTVTPNGLFGQIWNRVVPDVFRKQDNINAGKISANNSQGILSWKDNPQVVDEANAQGKVQLMQELDDISRSYPNKSKDARMSLALSNVAARTIDTQGGPVFIPKGQTMQSFFGVDQSVSPAIVGSALSTMHPAGKDQRVVYKVSAGGQMQWQVYSTKDGSLVNGGGSFDPHDVNTFARAEQDRQSARAMQTDGAGVTHEADGVRVNYNGNNTMGIGTASALQIRDDLYKYEGVRATPYDDASGKVVNGKRVQTVGVGVSTTSDFYPPLEPDGRVSDANISKSFMLASDRAMKQANTEAVKLPGQMQQNSSTMRLYTQLAYQGGSVPGDLVKAMKDGDRAGAMKALTDSPQYKMAHADRRKFYTDLMQGIMPVTN